MDNLIDPLQSKINEAKDQLSKEARAAIDSVNWKLIILGMEKKYSQEQLEVLEMETELLLCGISDTESYPKELGEGMHLSKEEVSLLITEIDKLIFQKIKEDLEKRVSMKEKTLETRRPLDYDPRFISMPKEVQDAIAHSSWKERLYEIASKYKLTIEQMGILEDTTVKVMSNVIHPNNYEDELVSKITKSKEDISNLVNEINEKILEEIRKLLKVHSGGSEDDEVPLPPYSSVEIKKTPEPKKVEAKTTPFGTYSSNFIVNIKKKEEEKVSEPVIPVTPVAQTIKEDAVPIPTKIDMGSIQKNIIEEKLKGATVSEHTISTHNEPGLDIPLSTTVKADTETGSKNPHDPYREII